MNQFTWYNPNYTVPTCQTPAGTGQCPDTQWWFWITAALIVAAGVSTK